VPLRRLDFLGFARYAAFFLRSALAALENRAYHLLYARSMLRISPSLVPVLVGVQGGQYEKTVFVYERANVIVTAK
jgi:hypothetical protein